jgi:hypothetical protein
VLQSGKGGDFDFPSTTPPTAWYILPIRATNNQPVIALSPHLTKSKYSPYQEAWHLLMSDAPENI